MHNVLAQLVEQMQISNIGGSWYLGRGKKALSNKELFDKLPSSINEEYSIKEVVTTLAEILDANRAKEKEAEQRKNAKGLIFDKESLMEALNDILEHEGITLDIGSMRYVRQIGINKDGVIRYETLDPTDFQTIVATNALARKTNTGEGVDGKLLLSVIEYAKTKARQAKLDELVSTIEHREELEGFADSFFKTMHSTLSIKQDLDVFQTLMKHFVWQVKRRIIELPTHNDIMLSFYGKQGIGKSYVMNLIFGGILGKFYNSSISLDNLMDERWTKALNTQFLMNIEEMDVGKIGFISGKNLALIKKVITGSEASYRPMGSNNIQTVMIKTSFISNANFHMFDIINDESGMRRFFEFTLGIEEGKRLDYDAVKELGEMSLKMFQSIDERLDKGYWSINSEVGSKIADIQKTYIKKPAHIEFFELFENIPDMKFEDCISHDDIYDEYIRYAKSQGIKETYIIAKNRFKSKILDHFGDAVIKSRARYDKYKLKSVSQFIPAEEYESISVSIPGLKRKGI